MGLIDRTSNSILDEYQEDKEANNKEEFMRFNDSFHRLQFILKNKHFDLIHIKCFCI